MDIGRGAGRVCREQGSDCELKEKDCDISSKAKKCRF